jgi:hypothetical protein
MARKRKPSGNIATVVPTKERTVMALSPDQIRSIYAKRRTKGQYVQFLAELLESGENGCDVKATWPQLSDKKATTIKQGFENAKEKKDAPDGSDAIDVIVDGEDVFLINAAQLGDLAEVAATA